MEILCEHFPVFPSTITSFLHQLRDETCLRYCTKKSVNHKQTRKNEEKKWRSRWQITQFAHRLYGHRCRLVRLVAHLRRPFSLPYVVVSSLVENLNDKYRDKWVWHTINCCQPMLVLSVHLGTKLQHYRRPSEDMRPASRNVEATGLLCNAHMEDCWDRLAER